MDCNQESRAVGIRSAYPCKKFSTRIFRKELHIPRLDEVEDVRVLVNAAIVHHNYRIRGRKWLHLIQRTLDEFVECCSVESAFNDITMEDTLFEGQCREDRVSGRGKSLQYMHYV